MVLICTAVKARKCIQFLYDGELRDVEPHAHGISKAGNEVVRAFQIRNHSQSGEASWRLFDVKKMVSLRLLETSFSPRPGYQRNDSDMQTIHCQV